MDALLEDLTDPQRKAVTHTDGPLLIIAAAGSGKTRVLTRRVAYLIAQGIPPSSVLAITFTNKSAGEMKHRVGDLMGKPIRDFGRLEQWGPTISTFHSLCLRILRHYAGAFGLASNFSIYDTADQQKVIKDALKALDISSTNFSPGTILGAISNAKNQLLTASDFASLSGDYFQRTVARVYSRYQQTLESNGALDFDDLLLRTVLGFKNHPDVLKELQERFQYVMIDEYQDTNRAQYLLAQALSGRHRNLCVVGDPDQSIYAWRGADLRNILDFERDYPDATTVLLEHNYRSTAAILKVADVLIKNNTQRKDKALLTDNTSGGLPQLVLCQDERDEATVVTDFLKQHNAAGLRWDQMAVFYRMNSLSRVMEEALMRANVPYIIARGTEFYGRKEIKDVLAYLRVIANPDDTVSLDRIVNTPARGISDGTVKSIQSFAIQNGLSLLEAMRRVDEISTLQARAQKAVQQFVQLVDGWRAMASGGGTETAEPTAAEEFLGLPTQPLADGLPADGIGKVQRLMENVVRRSGLEAYFTKLDPDREKEVPNVNELISSAREFDELNPDGELTDYLAQISLVSDTDAVKAGGGAVTLMSLHAAKGLEFPAVAMIGLEEGILPHSRARANPDDLEEERRLAFVGITRAQQHLMITKANYRTLRGLRERTIASPFLKELPADGIVVHDRTEMSFDPFGDSPASPAATSSGFRKGDKVRHPAFGVGTIAEVGDVGRNTRVVVDFGRTGRKTLLLEYAKLVRVA